MTFCKFLPERPCQFSVCLPKSSCNFSSYHGWKSIWLFAADFLHASLNRDVSFHANAGQNRYDCSQFPPEELPIFCLPQEINMYLFKLSPPKIDMTFLKFPPEALPIFCSPPEIEMYLFKIPRGANRYDFSQGSAGGAADFLSASGNRDVFFKLLPPILRLLFSRSRQRLCHFFVRLPKSICIFSIYRVLNSIWLFASSRWGRCQFFVRLRKSRCIFSSYRTSK